MKLKVDENLPAEIADDVRALGHDAMTVIEQGMSGVDGRRLMARAKEGSRLLMTLDTIRQIAARYCRSCASS